MSISQKVFLGPYAEWLVPEKRAAKFPPRDEDGDHLLSDRLHCTLIFGEPDVRKVGRTRYARFCYVPSWQGQPYCGREMHFSGQPAWPCVDDLTGKKLETEVKWFAKEFRTELRELAGHFGGEPTLRWGLLSWS